MTLFGIIAVALFAIAAVCELAASWKPDMKWRSRFKPFIVLTLLAWYVAASGPPRIAFIAALIFCLAGDVLLISRSRRVFFAGGAAFLLAHVLFIACFAGFIKPAAISALALLPAAAYAANIVFITARLRSHAKRSTVRSSIFYLIAVCAMSMAAFLLALTQGRAAGWLIFEGSVFFVASDSVLLVRNYRKDIKIPRVYFIVMVTYITALALITAGMAAL